VHWEFRIPYAKSQHTLLCAHAVHCMRALVGGFLRRRRRKGREEGREVGVGGYTAAARPLTRADRISVSSASRRTSDNVAEQRERRSWALWVMQEAENSPT